MKKKPPAKKVIAKEIKNESDLMMRNGLSEAILGFNPNNVGAQLSQVDTMFKNNRWYLISNMRQLLSQIYVEYGLVQTIIDVPVDDGLRGGVEIKTKVLSEEEIEELKTSIERDGDLQRVSQALKWNRLFGGAGVLIITDQDPSTKFDQDALRKDSPLEFRAVDMWELYWSKQNVSDYSVSIDKADPQSEFYNYYGKQVHRSRVLIMKGLEAPSFVRPRLRGWGFSVMESLVRSLNQYLKSTDLTFEVLDEFKIDIFKIKNLANTLLSSDGTKKVHDRIELANRQKNYQNAITMDSEDDYLAKELTFTGIAETMQGIRLQLASDMRMPLTKIFGISAAGFSSGEDDIENYNAMVESQVRQKSKQDILRMVEIKCQKLFEFIPDDLSIEFKPLRMLSAEQEENVKTQKFTRLLQAKQAGEMTTKEFKDACNKHNLLGIQLDTSIDTLVPEGGEIKKAESAPKSSLDAPLAKNALEDFDGPRIVTVGIVCAGEVLTGQRKDCGLWANPGGHWEGGETKERAACREVLEEAGIEIEPKDLKALPAKELKSHRGGKDFVVFPFVVNLEKKIMPKTCYDPDHEFAIWRWVPIDEKTNELKPESRYAKDDLVIKYLLGDKKFQNAYNDLTEKEKDKYSKIVMNPGKVDEGLWEKAKRAAEHAGADNKYAFATWWYEKEGGKFG